MTRGVCPRKKSSAWSTTLRSSRRKTTSRRTRFLRTTRRRSRTSAMTPSSGSMPTSSPRWRSSRRSRRRLRPFAIPSSPNFTRVQEVQECPTWEECQEVVCQVQEELLLEVDLVLDQPSRKSTNSSHVLPSQIKIVFKTYVILLQPAFLF